VVRFSGRFFASAGILQHRRCSSSSAVSDLADGRAHEYAEIRSVSCGMQKSHSETSGHRLRKIWGCKNIVQKVLSICNHRPQSLSWCRSPCPGLQTSVPIEPSAFCCTGGARRWPGRPHRAGSEWQTSPRTAATSETKNREIQPDIIRGPRFLDSQTLNFQGVSYTLGRCKTTFAKHIIT
jgi:hypothetical protein